MSEEPNKYQAKVSKKAIDPKNDIILKFVAMLDRDTLEKIFFSDSNANSSDRIGNCYKAMALETIIKTGTMTFQTKAWLHSPSEVGPYVIQEFKRLGLMNIDDKCEITAGSNGITAGPKLKEFVLDKLSKSDYQDIIESAMSELKPRAKLQVLGIKQLTPTLNISHNPKSRLHLTKACVNSGMQIVTKLNAN